MKFNERLVKLRQSFIARIQKPKYQARHAFNPDHNSNESQPGTPPQNTTNPQPATLKSTKPGTSHHRPKPKQPLTDLDAQLLQLEAEQPEFKEPLWQKIWRYIAIFFMLIWLLIQLLWGALLVGFVVLIFYIYFKVVFG